jgi:hypothetical protein
VVVVVVCVCGEGGVVWMRDWRMRGQFFVLTVDC